jgi:hypothetical protein
MISRRVLGSLRNPTIFSRAWSSADHQHQRLQLLQLRSFASSRKLRKLRQLKKQKQLPNLESIFANDEDKASNNSNAGTAVADPMAGIFSYLLSTPEPEPDDLPDHSKLSQLSQDIWNTKIKSAFDGRKPAGQDWNEFLQQHYFTQEFVAPPLESILDDGAVETTAATPLLITYTNNPHDVSKWISDHVDFRGSYIGFDTEVSFVRCSCFVLFCVATR